MNARTGWRAPCVLPGRTWGSSRVPRGLGALGEPWASNINRPPLRTTDTADGYVGRAESRVKARLVSGTELPQEMPVSTQHRESDDEPVRLLSPVASTEYEAWRQSVSDALDDLLAALHVETSTLQQKPIIRCMRIAFENILGMLAAGATAAGRNPRAVSVPRRGRRSWLPRRRAARGRA